MLHKFSGFWIYCSHLTKGDWVLVLDHIEIEVRRNCSNISSDDLGRVIMEDISRKSVTRSESKAGAALLATSRMHFEQMREELSNLTETSTAVCVYAYRQDATNDRKKRCTLELDSSYSIFDPKVSVKFMGGFTSSEIRRLSDVLPISDETAAGTMGFTVRALQSLGCPTWETAQKDPVLSQRLGFGKQVPKSVFFISSEV